LNEKLHEAKDGGICSFLFFDLLQVPLPLTIRGFVYV